MLLKSRARTHSSEFAHRCRHMVSPLIDRLDQQPLRLSRIHPIPPRSTLYPIASPTIMSSTVCLGCTAIQLRGLDAPRLGAAGQMGRSVGRCGALTHCSEGSRDCSRRLPVQDQQRAPHTPERRPYWGLPPLESSLYSIILRVSNRVGAIRPFARTCLRGLCCVQDCGERSFDWPGCIAEADGRRLSVSTLGRQPSGSYSRATCPAQAIVRPSSSVAR